MIGSIIRIAESIIMKMKRTIVIVSLVMIRMICFEYENDENGDSDNNGDNDHHDGIMILNCIADKTNDTDDYDDSDTTCVTNDKNDNDRTGNGDYDHSEIVILILEHWQYYNIDDNNDPDW